MDLRSYSEMHIGTQWSQTDHLFLVIALAKMDKLAQDTYNAKAPAVAVRSGGKQ